MLSTSTSHPDRTPNQSCEAASRTLTPSPFPQPVSNVFGLDYQVFSGRHSPVAARPITNSPSVNVLHVTLEHEWISATMHHRRWHNASVGMTVKIRPNETVSMPAGRRLHPCKTCVRLLTLGTAPAHTPPRDPP